LAALNAPATAASAHFSLSTASATAAATVAATVAAIDNANANTEASGAATAADVDVDADVAASWADREWVLPPGLSGADVINRHLLDLEAMHQVRLPFISSIAFQVKGSGFKVQRLRFRV
jgi:hypothetical protein